MPVLESEILDLRELRRMGQEWAPRPIPGIQGAG